MYSRGVIMPKGYLKFNLPEEQEDFRIAQNGWRYEQVISSFYEILRRKQKYEDVESMAIDDIRQVMSDLMEEWEITASPSAVPASHKPAASFLASATAWLSSRISNLGRILNLYLFIQKKGS
jgi:hypothetical protein